ncbi:helix-turn-helix domain-containing protein [Streptosporangium sandarakinum]
MNQIRLSPERFKALRDERGISLYALARLMGTQDSWLWRLSNGKTTSFKFLDRMVPVFGLTAVSEIIADPEQSEAFVFWHIANHTPPRRTARKTPSESEKGISE